jgi:hypothetical protein
MYFLKNYYDVILIIYKTTKPAQVSTYSNSLLMMQLLIDV